MNKGGGNGLRCAEFPVATSELDATARQDDAFFVRLPTPPKGYQLDGLVGPISTNGERTQHQLSFTYYASQCTRTLLVEEFQPGYGQAASFLDAVPSGTIRING